MTDHNKPMRHSLTSKTIRALFWSFSERISQQGVQLLVWIILARLLLPEEFGLVAMLTIFTAVAQSFIDSGFGSALIQKKNATHIDECSIFYFNTLIGFLAAALMCLAAPWIAAFYRQPLLISLTYVLSLNLIINAFALIQTTLLTKQINFKTLLKVNVIAYVLSGTIGVIMALKGFGVWSLAAHSLCSNLFRAVLLWFLNSWRPALVFSFASLRDMFRFGSRLLASGILNTTFQNIYLVVVGRLFSPGDLGLYSQASRIQQLPTQNLAHIIGRVTFPVFSTIQDDANRLKGGMRKALIVTAFINFPLMIGLVLVSRPLVEVVLTEKWAPCVPYLQLLCMVGVLFPLHALNLNLLAAKGRSDLFLRLEVLQKILIVISIAVTCRWGIMAMIYGQLMVSVCAYYFNSYYTGKLIDYPLREQVLDFAPYLAMSAAMGTGIYFLGCLPFESTVLLLILQVTAGVFLYTALNFALRTPAFIETLGILKDRLKPYARSEELSTYNGLPSRQHSNDYL